MKPFLILLLTLFLLSGCVTGGKIRSDIQAGMSRNEVIQALGNPDGRQMVNGKEFLNYSNRMISGWSWNQTDYTIVLENGRVTDYGHGAIRDHDAGIRAAAVLGAILGASLSSHPPTSEPAYDSSCPCPYSLDRSGNDCGQRSAWSRSGGKTPRCY